MTDDAFQQCVKKQLAARPQQGFVHKDLLPCVIDIGDLLNRGLRRTV